MELYFSDYFNVEESVLDAYGAFNVSIASDLPLFIDPFLLFNSEKPAYKGLHEDILKYLRFLRDKSAAGNLSDAQIDHWYRFKEVKQNWLGFTLLGNGGRALGREFALALNENLGRLFSDSDVKGITRSSHFEKVALLSGNVGRDGISDFTTTLIKEYLCTYTERFALEHLTENERQDFAVPRTRFNYVTEAWESKVFNLPILWDDFVLLTPTDILTRDDTFISGADLQRRFRQIPPAIPDAQLRTLVSNFYERQLGDKPSRSDFAEAVRRTIREFPEVLDYYIRTKEDSSDEATAISTEKVAETEQIFIRQLRRVYDDLQSRTNFYGQQWTSYDEVLARVKGFKHYIEHQDGYKVVNRAGKPFAQETEVQLFFGLIWFASAFDVNREPNNGRGPVDFKVSIGSHDKSLIEFKLASNSQLKRNLERQVEVYEKANQTANSVKVIICYTAGDQAKVESVLTELDLKNKEFVVVIDARSDNKPSASKA